MKKLLIILYFLFGIYVNAQKKNTHIIELLPNETESRLETDFYISKIIDNRIVKNNIGIAQKGLMNRKVLSNFSKPFEEELMQYLESILPKDSLKTQLYLRINQLLISEHTGAFKETGKAIVRLDVLHKDSLNNYNSLGYFTSTKIKNSMDVTRKHDDRIRAVIKDCLLQFDSIDRASITPYRIDIYRPAKAKVLTDSVEKGFFRTYMELVNNIALEDTLFRTQNRSTEDKLHLKDSSNIKITHFAYFDGKSFYLNASTYSGERHYIKTEQMDEFLLFSDVFVNQDDVMGMSMAFGVLGILASNQRQTVLFDINSGQFHPLTKSKMRLMLKNNYPDLYKTYKSDYRSFNTAKEILNTIYKKVTKEEFRALVRL